MEQKKMKLEKTIKISKRIEKIKLYNGTNVNELIEEETKNNDPEKVIK
jgi:hypothetical protein